MLYLNGQPVPVTMFPDKTSQVWKLPEDQLTLSKATIEWHFEHEGEFMHLAQLRELLTEYGVNVIKLRLKYLPYGRQDKGTNNKATFALYPFADLLNFLNFEQVEIVDPHSEHALDWIDNSNATYPQKLVEQVAQEMDYTIGTGSGCTIFCYPDKGALTKYSKVYEQSYRPHIYGEKVRDQLTGNILSYQVVGDCAGKNVLIVDDIVDGGATFKLLAKDLLAAGAKEVNLFATHGIFSKGVNTIKESGIKRIFTQDGEAFQDQEGKTFYRAI